MKCYTGHHTQYSALSYFPNILSCEAYQLYFELPVQSEVRFPRDLKVSSKMRNMLRNKRSETRFVLSPRGTWTGSATEHSNEEKKRKNPKSHPFPLPAKKIYPSVA